MFNTDLYFLPSLLSGMHMDTGFTQTKELRMMKNHNTTAPPSDLFLYVCSV